MQGSRTLESYRHGEMIRRSKTWTLYTAFDGALEVAILMATERRGVAPAAQVDDARVAMKGEYARWEKLEEHPHVPKVLAYLSDRVGMVYPALGGLSLREWRRKYPQHHDLVQLLRFLQRLLEGLAAAHAHGLLHRALSPDAIIVEDDPKLTLRWITGFALATALDLEHAWAQTGTLLGDPQYMAPEQFVSGSLTPATDVYVVGLLAYWLLTGEHAFEGQSVFDVVRAQTSEFPRVPDPALGLPTGVLHALQVALHKDPSKRFQNASALVRALDYEIEELGYAPTHGLALPVSAASAPAWLADSAPAAHEESYDTLRLPLGGTTQPLPEHGAEDAVREERAQSFYAEQQPIEERKWVSGNALSVDRKAVLREQARLESAAPKKALPPTTTSSIRPMAWASIAVMVVAVLGLALWIASVERARASRDLPDVPAVVGLPASMGCDWKESLAVNDEELLAIDLDKDQRLWMDIDLNGAELSVETHGVRRALTSIHGGDIQHVFSYRYPVSQRDFVLLVAGVGDAGTPVLHVLQLEDGRLLTQHGLPLSSARIEGVEVQLSDSSDGCVVGVRVRGDSGGGLAEKSMEVTLASEGPVLRSGGLAGLAEP